MKKKIFGVIASSLIFSHLSSVYAMTILNENIKEDRISSGVVLKNYDRFTNKGWLNINVLEVDLNDSYTDVGLLNSENGLSTFQTVYQMADKDNIIGAINGDFFNGRSTGGNTIGLSISDGKLLTTTYCENALKDTFASFILDEDNNAWTGYFTHKITLINKNSNEEFEISEYNKLSTNYEYPVIYTHEWGNPTFGSELSLTEMLIENNTVKEIRENGEPFDIPEDGFVVSAYGQTASKMLDIFKKKNRVELKIDMDLDIDKIKMAVSGGATLIENGEVPETFASNISGSHPRTAIGISKDEKTLFLITVDGRQAKSFGMSQTEFAEFLKEKGIYNAINLDGGGSTTMVARMLGENSIKTVNSPSGGTLRMVTNAIGIYNTKKTSSLSKLVLKVPEENVFVNSKMKIEVLGYDKYYNPVEVDFDDIDFDFSGVDIEIKDGFILAGNEAGTVNIHARNGKATGEISIDILSAPNEIVISPKSKAINLGESIEYSVVAKNKNGYYATPSNDDLSYRIISGDGEFRNNLFIPKSIGDQIIEVSIGDSKAYALVSVGDSNINILNSFEEKDFYFTSYPSGVTSKAYITKDNSTHLEKSVALQYDFSNTDATRAAYIRFEEPIIIDNEAIELSVKAFSEDDMIDYIKFKIVDAKGNTNLVMGSKSLRGGTWNTIKYNLNSISLPATLTDIYVAQDNVDIKTTGEVYFDELSIIYSNEAILSDIAIPQDIKGVTNFEEASNLTSGDSLKIAIFDSINEPKILLDKLVNEKFKEKIRQNIDVSIFTSQSDENIIEDFTSSKIISKKYEKENIENTLFLSIDVSSGGLRISDYTQWINLLNDIENAKESNVIIVMNGSLNDFSDEKERKLFIDTLCDLKRKTSKNILVTQFGNATEISMERGIKYLSVNNSSVDRNDPLDVATNLKYIELSISQNNDIYCEIKNITK